MKLIAIKRISKQLPVGAVFEQTDRNARMLILTGVARAADDQPAPRARRSYRRRDLAAEV
jgi:hypothetical protein